MFQRAVVTVAVTLAVPVAAQVAAPPAPPAPSAPAAPAAPAADPPPAPLAVKLTPDQIARDPRMIAALRHANNTADRKCGDVGGIVGLEQKTAGRACRKRFVDAAKADAEFEINGGK